MYGKDCCTSGGGSFINAPLAGKSVETKIRDCFVEGLVPYATCLLHAVEAFCEVPYPRFFSRGLKTRGLFHEDGFRLGEHTVEKGGFDVKVLNIPVQGCCDVEQGAE